MGTPCLALAPGPVPTTATPGTALPLPMPGTAFSGLTAPPCALPLGQGRRLLPAPASWGPWAAQTDSWSPAWGPDVGAAGGPVLPVFLMPPAVCVPGPRLQIT